MAKAIASPADAAAAERVKVDAAPGVMARADLAKVQAAPAEVARADLKKAEVAPVEMAKADRTKAEAAPAETAQAEALKAAAAPAETDATYRAKALGAADEVKAADSVKAETPAEPAAAVKAPPDPAKVEEAKQWASDKLANTPEPPPDHRYTPEQIRAAQEELKQVNADLYERVQTGELEHPNCTAEELKMAVEGNENGRIPLTYKNNSEAYHQLQTDLKNTFAAQGITDAKVMQIGSATQGWKGNPVKYLKWKEGFENGTIQEPWEVYGAWKPSSDTDFAVFSDQALVQVKAEDEREGGGVPVNSTFGVFKNGARAGDDPDFPQGKPGIANTPLGGKLAELAIQYNEIIYGEALPVSGGFDFKLNVENEPFRTPPTVYEGPDAASAKRTETLAEEERKRRERGATGGA